MNDGINITENVRAIEKLKSELLTGVSGLYQSLLRNDSPPLERTELLADILTAVYLLSAKTGVSYSTLDAKALGKLKLRILDRDNALYSDCSNLYRHIENRRSGE